MGDDMKIASINLRVNVEVDGQNGWPYRKEHMIAFIKKENFDVIGCQEAFLDMVEDLKEGLSDLYEIIYVPRDDRGEGTPVLYKKELLVIEQQTFWLTETENTESMIEGSHFPRIVTFVRFKDFLFFNTHLDYASDDVCLKQAKHLVRIIQKVNRTNEKVMVTGDFNMHPDSKTIQYMLNHFKSDYKEESINQLTFHGFSEQTQGKPIDYIFYSNGMKTKDFTIHYHQSKTYLSDHYPISVRMIK